MGDDHLISGAQPELRGTNLGMPIPAKAIFESVIEEFAAEIDWRVARAHAQLAASSEIDLLLHQRRFLVALWRTLR